MPHMLYQCDSCGKVGSQHVEVGQPPPKCNGCGNLVTRAIFVTETIIPDG